MVLAAAIREEIEIPEGVEVIIDDEVSVKGPNGEISRKFTYPNVTITKEDNTVVLETAFPKKKDKSMIGTTKAHITNMIIGDVQVDSTSNDLVKESELYFNDVIEEPAEKPKKKPRKTSKS